MAQGPLSAGVLRRSSAARARKSGRASWARRRRLRPGRGRDRRRHRPGRAASWCGRPGPATHAVSRFVGHAASLGMSGTARSLVPFVCCRGLVADARLRPHRSDWVRPIGRREGPRSIVMALPLPVIPPQPDAFHLAPHRIRVEITEGVIMHDVQKARGVLDGLRERLARGPLDRTETLHIGLDVARAMAHAHAGEVVHRGGVDGEPPARDGRDRRRREGARD